MQEGVCIFVFMYVQVYMDLCECAVKNAWCMHAYFHINMYEYL